MNKDMEVDLIYYELKLQSLLEKFLENGYHIKNDVYFNRLLSFLGGKENKDLAEVILKLPLMSEWILRAVKLWEDNSQTPDNSISAFTLQLIGLVSKNELMFTGLLKENIFNRVIHILQIKNRSASPSIKLGFIKLMTSLLAHPSGREWILQTTYWQDIIAMSLQSQTVYITKEGHFFISLLLDVMLQHNLSFCSNIWQLIITPLLTKPDEQFRNQDKVFEACDEEIEKFLSPTVYLVNDILEYFFERCLEGNNSHLQLFKNILMIPSIIESVTNYLYLVRNQTFAYKIGCIWILLLYLSMMFEEKNGVIKPNMDKDFMEPVFSLLNIMTESFKATSVSKFLHFILAHWYKLKAKIKVEYTIECDDKYKFEEQFIMPQLMPSFSFCRIAFNEFDKEDECRQEYITKLLAKLSKKSLRWGFKWRDSLGSVDTLSNIAPKAVTHLIQLKTSFSRNEAVTVFQCFLYSLFDVNLYLNKNVHYVPIFTRCENYLKTLLEALAEIILYFNISWKDSVESLCVFTASVEFLKIATWSSRLVIADLNLIKVGINRYMSPDLALLIDGDNNCAIFCLGPILYKKLHDPEWSVRDSALEIVSAIAEASRIDFPSFQKIILNNGFCNLVLTVSLMDGESFVRASALKCLHHLVQIDAFWKNHLENQDVVNKMISLLKRETEGIVRAQAATLLTTLYKYHNIPPSMYDEIYASMSSAALDDLYWEVRLSSLSFWNKQIEQKLKDQGMVDDEFPKCTFSPESRKIITLTDEEIKKRVLRVLDELSKIGCLTVLKHAISEDCDLQVSKRGLEVSKKLVDFIEKYKVIGNNSLEEMGPPSNDSCYSSIVSPTPSPSRQNSDNIIEQILRNSDATLLRDVYRPDNDYISSSVNGIGTPYRHLVTTGEFLNFTRQNFKSLVNDREKWLNSLDSLSSLLNDMLQNYEPNDTNAMDCY
ncbi:hypothetical protein HHI36_015387 [Cryptolaemus montrouzieri]|uniref:Uncharacterized protein n=1 Tax=Cryptolaemus montrouzieri TaxID=559131 RepID=A0ABD2N6M8_9CUCU